MLEQLKAQQTNLILQRAGAKDAVDMAERQLQIVGAQIATIEAIEAEKAEATTED